MMVRHIRLDRRQFYLFEGLGINSPFTGDIAPTTSWQFTAYNGNEGYQVLFVLNPLSTCWTVSGTMALSGAPLIFPSIDIATSPWSAAPMVRAKRSGSPATIFPAS